MALVNIQLDDAVFTHYVRQHGVPAAFAAMKKAIAALKDVKDGDRVIVLAGDTRLELEAVLGTTVDDAKKLLRLVKKMNAFKIGGVEVTFTDDELARIDMQAAFHGRTRDVFLLEMAQEIKDRMLERV